MHRTITRIFLNTLTGVLVMEKVATANAVDIRNRIGFVRIDGNVGIAVQRSHASGDEVFPSLGFHRRFLKCSCRPLCGS